MPSAGITTFRTDYLFCRSNQQRHSCGDGGHAHATVSIWNSDRRSRRSRNFKHRFRGRAKARVQARHQADRCQGDRDSKRRGTDGRVRQIFWRRRLQGRPHRGKEFVNSYDLLKGSGSYYGYSTYTFEDGSITARYTGSIKDGKSKGEYTILSGTGAYANATGTGTIESAPNPFKDKGVNLLDITLDIKAPGL